MQNINLFKINKKLHVYNQADHLKSYIDNFVNQKEIKKLFYIYQNILWFQKIILS